MREGGLEGIEAVVQRQERVAPKGNDDRLFLEREHRRLGLLGSGGPVGNRATLLPLGDGLRVDGDCAEFRVWVGHEVAEGAQPCQDANSRVFLMPSWTSFWPGRIPRRPLIRTAFSMI